MKDLRTEAIAGITTFFTMAYIVVVNPSILCTDGTGMPFSGVLTATVLLSFVMTLAMGLYADLPFAVAPGMGVNAFFTFNLILGRHIPWPTALGIVFWSGVLFLAVSATPLRANLALAMPKGVRSAAGAGIGVFLTFIGLKNAGLVVADPVTFVRLGELGPKPVLALVGMALACALHLRKSAFSFLIPIAAVTGAGWAMGLVAAPRSLVSMPDFRGVFLKADVLGALRPALLPAMVSLMFTDLFDSISTFVGVAHATRLLDSDDNPKNLRQGLLVDAFATLGAGLLGTSSGTAYIESTAGIEAGGRTGLTSVFTALCFLPCLFLAPLAGTVPGFATAPILILVGAFMFRSVSGLELERLEDAVPSFLTLVLIPLTFSITQGLLWGFLSHAVLYTLAGRRREVPPFQYGLAALSAGLLWLEHGAR
ncbi:MAG TPA: NCS2 family permease [Elusimicrobiota bacterium]|nr:NCS2 family permease [Elusimicrobiota bacterium]